VRADERVAHDVGRLVVQPDVVERQLERLARLADERRDLVRDLERRLPAVRECVNLDQTCCFARKDVLYARSRACRIARAGPKGDFALAKFSVGRPAFWPRDLAP
jgi:hypothetical protein